MIGTKLMRWARTRFAGLTLSMGAVAVTVAAGAGGCTTEAYCFRDCGSSSSSGTGMTGTGGEGGCINCTSSNTSFVTVGSGGNGAGGCSPTNNGVEVCDGIDNDCNGAVDDISGLDLTMAKTCGTCDHNCYTLAGSNWDPDSVSCTPSADPGTTPGTCHGSCAPDYWDIDKDAQGTCEYYCVKTADDDKTCDGKDDDCDGQTDEDVDLCTSTTDCGYCGHACVVQNGTGQCVKTGNGNSCDATNTKCAVGTCTCTGPGNCYWDADNNPANGCELKCDKTNGGVEICDGIDNDCNGVVDDNPTDALINTACQGGTKGICADPTHAGTYQCVAGSVSCQGANVVTPGQFQETCNGKDDDCDGTVDDNPVDTGPAFLCGQSAVLPCKKGTLQCVNGNKTCVGNIDPTAETCDDIDNDCDGVIDNNLPAAQSGAVCNTPLAPPAGATSPCKAGMTQCVGGSVQCVGSVLPVSGAVDACGVDSNCDGTLTNQPDLMTDVNNCGMCGHACKTPQDHAQWACVSGQCQFQGCQQGYYDIPANHTCNYACIFTSAQELCNGVDDNCDGTVDENVIPPSPTSVCGVSPSATNPECSTYNAASNPGGVSVACVNGGWQCTFHTAGVCNPTCAAASETCETTGPALDNNCNGFVNENVANYGQPCASDTGQPPPGDGVCRTTGTFVCSGPNAVACSATKDLTKAGPELCDGIDNDCDGLIDEPFTNPGSNKTYFLKPVVTKVSSSPALWIYSYEASRPSATNITAGTGNGFYTSAPTGKTIDKTPACSVTDKIPWFDVTGFEVDQTCAAMGGHTCSPTEWQTACFAKTAPATSCTYGYAPAGTACTSGFVAGTKFCNLGLSYDLDGNAANGVQNGLLPTGSAGGASPKLASCWADWSGVLGNTANVNDRVYDITGNLREITKAATNQYTLMGGAFDSTAESGAACGFTFYNVDQNFEFFDTGFRCCFSQDPTIYTCGNNAKDGTETDVDCGGAACGKCATGKGCLVASDCTSNVCISATKKCQ
ncbi:MAG: MopE-related protein [Minicystis sp.]